MSGAKINFQKSKGSWLGEWNYKPGIFMGMQCTAEVGHYLGIKLDFAIKDTEKWQTKLQGLHGKLQPFGGRELTLMHRSMVCNTVLYPRMLYAAQAVSIDTTTIQRFHRICATYVWNSKFEKMRRGNIYWSVEGGGLGVVNFEIKMQVQRFLYFRDEANPALRAAMQSLGTRHLAQWIASTEPTPPDGRTLRFYKEIADSIKFFLARFSWAYLANVRKRSLYWDTVANVFPPPLYRLGYTGRKDLDVLNRIKTLPVPTATKDFFVRFHIEVLPAKEWLKGKGFIVPQDGKCDVCGQPETLRHILFDCKNALLFWSDLRRSLKVDVHASYDALKFLAFTEAKNGQMLSIIAVAGLHAIWRARTARVERDVMAKSPVEYLKMTLMWSLSLIGTGRLDDEHQWQEIAPTIRSLDARYFGCHKKGKIFEIRKDAQGIETSTGPKY